MPHRPRAAQKVRSTAFALALAGSTLTGIATAAAGTEDRGVADSAKQVQPLLVGASVPDTTLLSTDGVETSLHQQVKGRHSILIFYRGGW